MAVEIALGVVVLVLVILAATVGRARVASDNREKMAVLSRLDGQEVILWLSFGGRVQVIAPRRGRLQISEGGASSVGLAGDDKHRLVFLGQIRWIEDPKTGTRVGDRQWGRLH